MFKNKRLEKWRASMFGIRPSSIASDFPAPLPEPEQCEWCDGDWVIEATAHRSLPYWTKTYFESKDICYCPLCGKQLEANHHDET